MKNLASLAVLLLSVPGVLLANAYQLQAESTQLPFKVVQELILVDASVNGQEGKFLFDTGAADLTLNISHFATNSRPSKNHYIADINGFNHNPRLLDVQHFVLGMVERKNFTVPVINLSVLERELGESILGVISTWYSWRKRENR